MKKPPLILFFIIFVFSLKYSKGQSCNGGSCNLLNKPYPTSGPYFPSIAGTWYPLSSTLNSGNYATYSVLSGETYEWTTCSEFGGSQGWDAELTLFNNSNIALCYNDDCGRNSCPNSPYISWTSNFTGTVKVLISEYNCKLNANVNGAPYSKLMYRRIVPSCTPTAPSSLTASIGSPPSGSNHPINLTASPVIGINGYNFEYSPNNSQWYLHGGNLASNFVVHNTQDNPNTPYYYRVRTFCGTNNYSSYTYSTPYPIYTACDIPMAPILSNATGTTIKISLIPETPVSNPDYTNYGIFCNTTGQYVDSDGFLSSERVMGAISVWNNLTISGLNKNTTYVFSAFARNRGGILTDLGPSSSITTTNQCIIWTNGFPSTTNAVNASEYLCVNGIIKNTQDYQALYNITLGQVALATFKALYNGDVPSNHPLNCYYFPSLITDLENLESSMENVSAKALSFLEYQDGQSCISRNFAVIHPYDKISWGRILRILLEAWKIAPDNIGINIYDHGASTFLPNILKDNPDYGYFKRAYQLGLLNDLILPNGNFDFRNRGEFFFLMLYKLKTQYPNPLPQDADYYRPNNFSPLNTGSEKGVSKAIFETWEQSGLDLPSGGLGLNFDLSYHSDLLDYPLASEDRSEILLSANNYSSYGNLENQNAIIKNYPLGVGWTHSFNIYSNILISQYGNSGPVEKFLMLNWGDGRVNFYHIFDHHYMDKGITDNLLEDSFNANGNLLTFRVITKSKITYYFERNNNQFYCKAIIDKNGNELQFTYESAYCNNPPSTCLGATSTRLKTITDTFGSRSLTFNYANDSDLLRSVTDGTRTVSFTSDKTNLNLNSFVDPKGQITTYNYCVGESCLHQLTTITRPKGNIINNSYEKRKLKQTNNNNYSVNISFGTNYQQNTTLTNSTVTVVFCW